MAAYGLGPVCLASLGVSLCPEVDDFQLIITMMMKGNKQDSAYNFCTLISYECVDEYSCSR